MSPSLSVLLAQSVLSELSWPTLMRQNGNRGESVLLWADPVLLTFPSHSPTDFLSADSGNGRQGLFKVRAQWESEHKFAFLARAMSG